MKTYSILAALAATLLLTVHSQAQITGTYVDATGANTGPASAFVGGSFGNPYDGSFSDGLWDVRTGGAAGAGNGNVLEGGNPLDEDVPLLTTTVGGLDPLGIYDIRVIYYTTASPDGGWAVAAGISGGPLASYGNAEGMLTGADASPNLNQRQAVLGQVQGVTSFAVDVDTDFLQINTAGRAWYDGVSFDRVGTVPEPCSAVLMCVAAGLAAIGSQRRPRCECHPSTNKNLCA